MTTAPLVGLTTYREPARCGVWDQSADLLPSSYARAVEAAGGVPVLLPPTLPYAAAAEVAVAAATATASLTPRVGRARPLAERSIGTPDAGATSMGMLLRAVGELLSAGSAPRPDEGTLA